MISAAVAISGLIGVLLGLLGSGGSILALPVLVYLARVTPQQAVAMSLVIVGGSSLVGAYLHYRRGQFDGRVALLFAGSGIVGAFFGSLFTNLVPGHVLMLLFAALMLVVGVAMFRSGGQPPREQEGDCRILRCLAAGVAVGVLTGFLGVGGGFLIVPSLVFFAGITTSRAIGTSLAVIALNSASGLTSHLRHGVFRWELTLGFLAAALAGMWLGTSLSSRISDRVLRRVFAWVVVCMGIAVGTVNAVEIWAS